MAPVKNPLFARYFNRFGARREERGNRELRREMLAGLSGRVMEVGPGSGLNFPHYPLSVQEVVAVEPEPYLRDRAVESLQVATGKKLGDDTKAWEEVLHTTAAGDSALAGKQKSSILKLVSGP